MAEIYAFKRKWKLEVSYHLLAAAILLHVMSSLFPIFTSLYQICNTDSIFGTFSKGKDQFQCMFCVLMETIYLWTPKLLIDREDTFCCIFLYFTCVSDEKIKGLSVFRPELWKRRLIVTKSMFLKGPHPGVTWSVMRTFMFTISFTAFKRQTTSKHIEM